jgi:Spy/CpxP family protein refolding chaperone
MKISLIAFIFFFATFSVSAQIERKPVAAKTDSTQAVNDDKAKQQNRKDRMKELNLTREQKNMLKDIHRSGKAEKDAIENNTQLSEEEKKKRLRELQKKHAEKLQAILTPEQLAKFKASRQSNP